MFLARHLVLQLGAANQLVCGPLYHSFVSGHAILHCSWVPQVSWYAVSCIIPIFLARHLALQLGAESQLVCGQLYHSYVSGHAILRCKTPP
jgi:hypothetical protein